jgi:hypothetical protein
VTLRLRLSSTAAWGPTGAGALSGMSVCSTIANKSIRWFGTRSCSRTPHAAVKRSAGGASPRLSRARSDVS